MLFVLRRMKFFFSLVCFILFHKSIADSVKQVLFSFISLFRLNVGINFLQVG